MIGTRALDGSNLINGLFDRYAVVTIYRVPREFKFTNNHSQWELILKYYFKDCPLILSVYNAACSQPYMQNEVGREISYEIPKNSDETLDIIVILPIINEEDSDELAKRVLNRIKNKRKQAMRYLSMDDDKKLFYNLVADCKIPEFGRHPLKDYKVTVWGEYRMKRTK